MYFKSITTIVLSVFSLLFVDVAAAVSMSDYARHDGKEITQISIHGLTRTEEKVVTRELLIHVGDKLSLANFESSVQRLKNLRIFSFVDAHIVSLDNDQIRIELDIQERWTLIPIAKFTEGGDTMYYVLGLYNVNSFGKYLESGIQYESWNNQPGGVVWFRDPRFMGKRLLVGGDFWSVKRPRALYQADGSEQGSYVAQRKRVNSFIDKELHDGLVVGLGVEFIEDRIVAIEDANLLDNQIKTHLDEFQPHGNLLLSLRGTLGKLNHHGEIMSGKALNLYAGYSSDRVYSDENYYKFDVDAKAFWKHRHSSNIGLRLRMGSTNSAKLPNYYFLGGFENVRGYLDGQIRARSFWQSNLEYRQSLVKKPWYYLQAIAFVDAIQALRPDSALEQDNREVFSSLGLGLRIGSPKIYRFNLRMDLALATSHPATSRFSMGVQQFF